MAFAAYSSLVYGESSLIVGCRVHCSASQMDIFVLPFCNHKILVNAIASISSIPLLFNSILELPHLVCLIAASCAALLHANNPCILLQSCISPLKHYWKLII